MSEAKSRYGIMQELSERKVREREKLNKLQNDLDSNEYKSQLRIDDLEDEVKNKQKSYVREHKLNVRELTVRKKVLETDMKRKVSAFQTQIDDAKTNYEQDFQDWKANMVEDVASGKAGLKLYVDTQNILVAQQEDIIKEIDNSIASLKEISAEQKAE